MVNKYTPSELADGQTSRDSSSLRGSLSLRFLRDTSASNGLLTMSWATVAPLFDDEKRFIEWQKAGYAADMAYMRRPLDAFWNPASLLPEAKSLISFAVRYESRLVTELPKGHGRVARYAWGADYHGVIKDKIHRVVACAEKHLGRKIKARVFCDAVPLLEKAVAARAGLGFIGRNSLLIRPKEGSFFFIGELLWDVALEDMALEDIALENIALENGSLEQCADKEGREVTSLVDGCISKLKLPKEKSLCGTCSRCLDTCPTLALVRPYVLDAGRCIAYLTIEKHGSFTIPERKSLGEWVFGCDICQESCPFNQGTLSHGQETECEENKCEENKCEDNRCEDNECGETACGSLPLDSISLGPSLELGPVLRLRTEEEFEIRFSGTSFMRTGRESLLRNVACVSANTLAFELRKELKDCAEADSAEVVRLHARWALCSLDIAESGKLSLESQKLLEKAVGGGSEAEAEESSVLLKENL